MTMKKGVVYDLRFDDRLSTVTPSVVYKSIECEDIRPSGIYVVKFMNRFWTGTLAQLTAQKTNIVLSIDAKEGIVTSTYKDKKKTVYRWETNQSIGGGGATGADEHNPVSYSTFSSDLFSMEKYTNELFSHKTDTQSQFHLNYLNERKMGCIDHLKKDVYKNHSIFINASKEIANSEVDMLDFRNLITEYGNSITSLQNLSINWDHYFEVLSASTEPIQWLTTVPHELDRAIEQREYGDAIDVVEKSINSKVEIVMQTHPLKEQIDTRIKSLTESLIDQLRSQILKPKQIKETIDWLVRLGQSDKAKSIFLESRSTAIQQAIKKVNISGDLVRYIGELTRIIFSSINTTSNDYLNAFPEAYMTSGLVEWVIHELELIADIFNRQVLIIDNFQTISQIMHIVESHCEMMDQNGLSLTFYWSLLLQPHIEGLIINYENRIKELLQQHLADEKWIGNTQWDYELPTSTKTSPTSGSSPTTPTKQQQSNSGESNLKLTESTIFLNTIIQRFANDLCHIVTLDMIPVISTTLGRLFKDFIGQLLVAIQRKMKDNQSHAIISDAVFICEDLLFRIANKFEDVTGRRLNNIDVLKESLDGSFQRIRDEYAANKATEVVHSIMSWDEDIYRTEEEIDPNPKKFVKLAEYLDVLTTTIQTNINVESVLPIISRVIAEIVVIMSQTMMGRDASAFGYGGLQHYVLEMRYLSTIAGKYPFEVITFESITNMIEHAIKVYAAANGYDPETVVKPNEFFTAIIDNLVHQKTVYK
eukprot:gene13718-16172_t